MRVSSEQLIAANINAFHDWKTAAISENIQQTIALAAEETTVQNHRLEEALQQLGEVRQFLSSPQHILGSVQTKHGEIAEHFDVHVRNAQALFEGQQHVATFDGIGRTAPVDFVLHGIETQSKFLNTPLNSLNAILKHVTIYENKAMNYMISQDQFDIIAAARAQNIDTTMTKALAKKITQIEALTGRSFDDVVQRSVATYEDVQVIHAYDTLHNHYEQFSSAHAEQLEAIEETKKRKVEALQQQLEPSFKEGAKITGVAIVVSASIQTMMHIYKKIKAGKPLHQFTIEDWQDVGIEATKAGAKGGVTAASIYTLTNVTSLNAPFAGALVSASFGIARLLTDYKKGETTMDDVFLEGQIICIEAALAATGAVIGQTLIPIPVLGAIIGSVSANIFCSFVRQRLQQHEHAFRNVLDAYMNSLHTQVDAAYHDIMTKIERTYNHYNTLIDAAFDVNTNHAARAAASITLAEAVGVEPKRILRTPQQLDDFFTR